MATTTIINHRKHNLVADGVMLRPGENVIDEKKAKKLIANSQAVLWHKLRWIGVKPAAAKTTGLAEDLDAGGDDDASKPISAADAIKFVAGSDDVHALEGMLEGEARKTVKAAIEKRLAELEADGDDGDAEDTGEGDDGDGDEG